MKKRLFGILTFLGIGLSFCSAESFDISFFETNFTCGDFECYGDTPTYSLPFFGDLPGDIDVSCSINYFATAPCFSSQECVSSVIDGDVNMEFIFILPSGVSYIEDASMSALYNSYSSVFQNLNIFDYFDGDVPDGTFPVYISILPYFTLSSRVDSDLGGTIGFSCSLSGDFSTSLSISSGSGSCSPSSIDVLYNNENSTTNIICNGDNVIQIDGLSTITSTNTFTPYFNINYRDEDNQSLIESYSKDILYLSGSLFKKTFTGDNERILTSQLNNNSDSFSGYVPTFDVVFTGDTFNDTGNVFNNFAQNSLQVALSNIPSYIQYVIIIMLLFFILGLARRKKRR